MKKNIFICIGVVAVLCGVFLAYARLKSPAPVLSKPPVVYSGDATIFMTQDGFEPEEIHVTKGAVVHFKNTDTYWHWPASDLHPSHGIYPEFDPHKAIPPGEEWVFVFDRVGVWAMHDHLAPYVTGKIFVTEK